MSANLSNPSDASSEPVVPLAYLFDSAREKVFAAVDEDERPFDDCGSTMTIPSAENKG